MPDIELAGRWPPPRQPAQGGAGSELAEGDAGGDQGGVGITALPDYMHTDSEGLVQVLADVKAPKIDAHFVYPEELRNSKRVAVFRDFLLGQLNQR